MELTRTFSQLHKGDANIAGGKGASLGEMLNAHIPVPDGFVVLSTTFDEFLKQADLIQEIDAILDAVDHKAVHSIDKASEEIQGLIKNATMPTDIAANILRQFEALHAEFVAVRSSATAEDGADNAWAGQLDSYLNTTKETVLMRVQECWASLFTSRAIFYRFEKGLHTTHISVAVVVQKMVNSEKSGIAFSVHPVTEDRNQLIIEAGFGLGEAIVSGSVTPDSYVVEKEPRRIIDINVSNQTRALYRKAGGGNEWRDLENTVATSQVLDESEILRLAEIILHIESHYGFPCDIEWAYEDDTFYIVQSRPITTLDKTGGTAQKMKSEKFSLLIEEKEASPFVASNLCEVMATRLGNYITVSPNSIFHFQNHDLSWCTDLAKWDIAAKEVVAQVLNTPEIYTEFNAKLKNDIDELKEFAQKSYYSNITTLSNKDLQSLFLKGIEKYNNVYERGIIPTIADLHEPFLTTALKKELENKKAIEPDKVFITLTTPEQKSDILKEELDLINIALDKKSSKNEIENHKRKYFWLTYGYNGPEYSLESIQERIQVIRRDEHQNNLRLQELENWSSFTKHEIKEITEKYQLSKRLQDSFKVVQQWIYLKGARKEAFFMCYALFDKIAAEISTRTGIPFDELKFMTKNEIVHLLSSGQRPTDLNERLNEAVYVYQDKQVTALSGERAQLFLKTSVIDTLLDTSDTLVGQVAYPGIVRGIVKIVNEPKDMSKINEGDILVSAQTNPNIIPAMQKASGFLTDLGGITSHAAIVAREMKKPCIIGAKTATKALADGDLIELDADQGIVRILGKGKTTQEKWKVIAGDFNTPFIKNYCTALGYAKYKKEYGFTMLLGCIGRNTDLDYIALMSTWDSAHAILKQKVTDDPEYLNNILDIIEKSGKETNEWTETNFVKTNLKELSNEQLFSLIEGFIEKQSFLYTKGTIFSILDYGKYRFVEGNLNKIFSAKLSTKDEQDEALTVFTTPTINSFQVQEDKELKEILVKYVHQKEFSQKILSGNTEAIQRDFPEFWKDLQSHTSKYNWLFYSYMGPAYIESDFLNMAKEILSQSKNLAEEIENYEKNLRQITKKREEFIKKINPNSFEKTILNIAEKMVWAKPRRKDYQSKSYYHLSFLLKEVAERLNLTLDEVFFCTIDMLRDGLLNKSIDKNEIESVKKLHIIIPKENGTVKVFIDSEAEDFYRNSIEEESGVENTGQIKGTVAFKGFASGIVKIINKPSEMEKMNNGDILVSLATTPDIVPAMKKAAAIVTDKGGLTCHAAIVARELKVPCIVGTEHATQLLKDGDKVEVDATIGLIRILS